LENREEHLDGPIPGYPRPVHELRRRVDEDDGEVPGKAVSGMIERLGLLPDDDWPTFEPADKPAGEGECLPVSLQAEGNAAEMRGSGLFTRKGLPGVEGGDRGAPFPERIEHPGRQKSARVEDRHSTPVDLAARQPGNGAGQLGVGQAEEKDGPQPGRFRVVGQGAALADNRPAFQGRFLSAAGQGAYVVSLAGEGAAQRCPQPAGPDEDDIGHALRACRSLPA